MSIPHIPESSVVPYPADLPGNRLTAGRNADRLSPSTRLAGGHAETGSPTAPPFIGIALAQPACDYSDALQKDKDYFETDRDVVEKNNVERRQRITLNQPVTHSESNNVGFVITPVNVISSSKA